MAHLFISYSRTDRDAIERLAAALEAAGHSVWWDRHIRGGASFAKDIEAQLVKADAIIVVWSPDANASDWVKDEAVYARDKGTLIPICLTDCEAPLGFRQYQVIDFQEWKGDAGAPEVQSVLGAIAGLMGDAAPKFEAPAQKTLIDKIKARPRIIAGVLAAAFIGVALFAFTLMRAGPDGELVYVEATGPLPAPGEVSIAVLPFVDMSPEGDQGYFADGLSEELLNVLVHVDGLKVASRTSSFALKDEALSVGDIAERLKVNHVLEGSVRKVGARVKITAQLIDARDDRHLWSETYDRQLSDLFRIQEEIATAVVAEMRNQLGMEERAPINIKVATGNMSAYDTYLKARKLFAARGKANVVESLRLFEQVVAMDPTFAKGWEGLAAVYGVASSYSILDRDYSALALFANKRALELDPDLSMPYAVIGLTYRAHYPTPWIESFDNLNKALEQDPKNASAWQWLGMNYISVGEAKQAIHAFNACLEIDEARRLCRRYRAAANIFLGNVDLAIVDAGVNAEVNYFSGFDAYIPIFLERGDRIMAFAASRMVNWREGFPHKEYISALENPESQPPDRLKIFMAWGDEKRVDVADKTNLMLALRAYDKINVDTFDNDYEDLWLPQFAHYRRSQQFKQLAEGLGLTPYWRARGFPPQCHAVSEADFECN
jgi:TolB-like protein